MTQTPAITHSESYQQAYPPFCTSTATRSDLPKGFPKHHVSDGEESAKRKAKLEAETGTLEEGSG